MDGLSDFVDALVLEDVAEAGVEGGLLGCDTLLNLRDFRSEALVLGNCTVLRPNDEAEERTVVDLDAWATFASTAGFFFADLLFSRLLEAPLIRRFLRGRWLFALSGGDDVANAEVDKGVGGVFEMS